MFQNFFKSKPDKKSFKEQVELDLLKRHHGEITERLEIEKDEKVIHSLLSQIDEINVRKSELFRKVANGL